MSFEDGSGSRTVVVMTNCCISNGLRTEKSEENTDGAPITENEELNKFSKDQDGHGSHLQKDRDQISGSDVLRSINDQSFLERRAPKGATPVTNGKNTEPEQSNENRGVVGGQKPSSIPDSATTCREVSLSDPMTPTENTATRGPAAGDKRPGSGHNSNASHNTSAENANTIKHCNANPFQDSTLADDGKMTQSSVSEDDAPKNEREQTALAVAGIMHEEHDETLGRETSCQPETHGLSNPSCDRIVSHANSKRPFKDQPFYGAKFQKLECKTETSQSPGSVDHSLMADDKASESVVASFEAREIRGKT